MKNTKLQAPKETSNSKLQKTWLCRLNFGAWSFLGTWSWVLGAFLWSASVRAADCCVKAPSLPPATFTDKSIYQSESSWTTDAGKEIKLGALRGKPQIVAMFFASCQFTCPITVSDMKRIEAALPENIRTNVGFTLVSFDSQRDTPVTLHAFRANRELSNKNWTLLRGGADDVSELAALLGVNYRRDAAGNFGHSNLVTLLNAEGEIVFQQPGLNLPADEMVKKISALLEK